MKHLRCFLIGVIIALSIALGVDCFGQMGSGAGSFGSVGNGGGSGSVTNLVAGQGIVLSGNNISAPSVGNATNLNGLAASAYLTNSPGIVMYSNKVFWIGSGYSSSPHFTNFPASTTAGLQELQQMFPAGAYNGINITIAPGQICPGDGSWTNWVDLTNSMSIEGVSALPYSSVLRYAGPGFSQSVIDAPPLYQTDGAGAAVLWCDTNTIYKNFGIAATYGASSYSFRNFTFQMATTNNCVGIGGFAIDATIDNVCFIGPHYLTGTNTLNGLQLRTSAIPYAPNLIAASLNVFQLFIIEGAHTFVDDEFTCGFESCGNPQGWWMPGPYCANIGEWSGGTGSAFPSSSIYSQGVAYLVDNNPYQFTLDGPATYNANIGIGVADGADGVVIENYEPQDTAYPLVLDNANGVQVIAAEVAHPITAYLWTNSIGNWGVDGNLGDNNYSQFNNGGATAQFTWSLTGANSSSQFECGLGNAVKFSVVGGHMVGNGQSVTNISAANLASGNTSTSNNWTGSFSGNGGAVTNVGTAGVALLHAGTNQVMTSAVNYGSVIELTPILVPTCSVVSEVYFQTNDLLPGVSFTIHSTSGTDTNEVSWFIRP